MVSLEKSTKRFKELTPSSLPEIAEGLLCASQCSIPTVFTCLKLTESFQQNQNRPCYYVTLSDVRKTEPRELMHTARTKPSWILVLASGLCLRQIRCWLYLVKSDAQISCIFILI